MPTTVPNQPPHGSQEDRQRIEGYQQLDDRPNLYLPFITVAHVIQHNKPAVRQPQRLVERELQGTADNEKRQREKHALCRCVPEEEFAKFVFHYYFSVIGQTEYFQTYESSITCLEA